ncbi:MAG: hypothetical protein UHD05_01695 [Ruminococcus sp.]|nr:hypothetical protein [Ruminococcus sp.]
MSELTFLKGGNIVIKLDGQILGGVTKAVCSAQNSYNEICEFLTDIPVEKIPVKNYRIELVTKDGNTFMNDSTFKTIQLSDENKIVEYEDCYVESAQAVINSKGSVEYKVIITAETRNVI